MANFRFKTNASSDVPDSRDFIYNPSLKQISSEILPRISSKIPSKKPQNGGLIIRNQGSEGACTGFSLTAVINFLNQRRGSNVQVSPRMLYEMAKKNDEWPGEEYDGSSLRGAIKGWKNMGVCSEEKWEYQVGKKHTVKHLTIDAAEDARMNTIGAYYRLMPEISHFHNAINEAGIIAVSAHVHDGWEDPVDGIIGQSKDMIGGHAFAIVGYNDKGFIVQNSWGKNWGDKGTALWSYEDWIDNVMDAWVVSLAIPTPQIFGKEAVSYKGYKRVEEQQADFSPTVDRAEIAGHFIHIDDGEYHDKGRYWSNADDVEQTAKLVADSKDYQHLLFYFHGGLNSPKASARRIRAMKDGFKRNGIYPYHIMYDTGLVEEMKDLILRKGKTSTERVGGVTDWTDRFLEGLLRVPGTLVWDEMKRDAEDGFSPKGAGLDALGRFIKHLLGVAKAKNKKIHLVGHSTGAIVIAHLLRALQSRQIDIASCSLLAPAASVDLFTSHYLPICQGKKNLKLKSLEIYNLHDHLEEDDNVAQIYRKSLLYLVSNSFEHDGRETPIVGMEKFCNAKTSPKMKKLFSAIRAAKVKPVIHYSNGNTGSITQSTSHGGFDNDPITMNHVLKSVLGKPAKLKFTEDELAY